MASKINECTEHSPLLKPNADVHFPDPGTESKNASRIRDSVVGPISSSETVELNNNLQSWLR